MADFCVTTSSAYLLKSDKPSRCALKSSHFFVSKFDDICELGDNLRKKIGYMQMVDASGY